jgi:hypothetical protein
MIKKGPAIRNVKATGTPLTFTNGITGTLRALRAERDIPEPVVIPNYFFSRIPPFSFRLPETANLADRIYSGWIDILESFSITLRKNEKSYIRRFALYYLSWGMRDIKATLPFDLENSVYFSGTGGGYWNRLIGCRVKAAGGRVIQMDHGGERPFFADRWWGINEFAFCDEFVTFTAAGAVAIKRNIEKEYRTLLENPSALEVSRLENNNFTSLAPSVGKKGRADEAKSIMFVPTGFMGEFNTVPSFTIHDVPYAIFQIKILEALESSGKKIFYKQAPKALLDALFSPEKYGAEIVRGKLSECLELPDAFLFTFAGTAFCEALCTDKPVIFLKVPPFRPQTNEQEQEFASACRIIRGSLDSGNCPDINMEKLKSAFAAMTETELENRRKFRKKWLTGK